MFDDSEQDILPHFTEANLFIKQALTENETNRVLVHCTRGISRAASFVTAYMIAEAEFSLEEALTYGELNREHFAPNKNFLSQLRTFEKVFGKPDLPAEYAQVMMRQLSMPKQSNEEPTNIEVNNSQS